MPQKNLAMLLGIHKTMLPRIICHLQSMGVIQKFTKKRPIITDLNRLKSLAEG